MKLTSPFLCSVITFTALSLHAYAGDTSRRSGFKIDSEVTDQSTTATRASKNSKILSDGMQNWTVLADLHDGLVLLGRLAKGDVSPTTFEYKVDLEYLVLDTSTSPNGLVYVPAHTVSLKHPNQTRVKLAEGHDLYVTTSVKETQYREVSSVR